MTRWFRMYDAVLDDAKVQRLADPAFRAWVNLMCLASRNEGKITGDYDDIGFALRLDAEKARDLVQVLISAGLIEQTENGLEPHNWATRQYRSDVSTERVKRFREQASPVSETPPEQKQSRTEQKETPACAGSVKPETYSEGFEAFWSAYPRDSNMPKKPAYKQWQKLSPEKRQKAVAAIPGFRAYCDKNKGWYRPIYADRFLSQEKFEGYAAMPAPSAEEVAASKDRADQLLKRGKYDPMKQAMQ